MFFTIIFIFFLNFYAFLSVLTLFLLSHSSYIPFSSVFVAPVNVLFGSMTIAEGLIITVIMIVCVIAMLKVLGTVYERLVFNTLSLKQLISKKTT